MKLRSFLSDLDTADLDTVMLINNQNYLYYIFPDLVKRIHRQQHNPWHVQGLNDLIGNCGFP